MYIIGFKISYPPLILLFENHTFQSQNALIRARNSIISNLRRQNNDSKSNTVRCGCGEARPLRFDTLLTVLFLAVDQYDISICCRRQGHLLTLFRLCVASSQVQFFLTMSHSLSAVLRPCGFPMGWLYFQISYMVTLIFFFSNFYIQVSGASILFCFFFFLLT